MLWGRFESELGSEVPVEAFARIAGQLPPGVYSGGRASKESLHGWASGKIDYFTDPSSFRIVPASGHLSVNADVLLEIEILKQLTAFFVIDRPSLGSAQRGQSRLIRELFIWLAGWCMEEYPGPEQDSPAHRRSQYTVGGLPARLLDFLDISFWQPSDEGAYAEDQQKVARSVVDYIASLTEQQALELHGRLGGTARASMLDAWYQV